ncbi:unnamed protein product [Oncorhynchus mykiss]|uniref:Uncharacterized protein n=1 Tax=Oncorhynchus mykiss TaxID=8022 RepID=A0A060X1K6_ONCMY|nr:unnamed protein product [Oncorhynchus mykiss]
MPLPDYGDILYMNASAQCLRSIDTLYHGTLRFILNCKTLMHHCTLYTRVGWPSLVTRRLSHWYTFIYKAILGLLPFYLCIFIVQKCGGYSLHSLDFNLLMPKLNLVKAIMYSAPSSWNTLQNTFKLEELVRIGVFKSLMKDFEVDSLTCQCF